MLSLETYVEYAQKEIQRNPEFKNYLQNMLDKTRCNYPLPNTIEECLAFPIGTFPLAKYAIEAYEAIEMRPDWQRAREADPVI